MEELKVIEGYEYSYKITSYGRIWSDITKKFLKKFKDRYGYLFVRLCKDGKAKFFQVHRLVALTFINGGGDEFQVNHKDGNKENNHVCNLEWCTSQENHSHAMINNLKSVKDKNRKYHGIYHSTSYRGNKRWVAQITIFGKQRNIGYFNTSIEAAKAYNDFILNNNLGLPLNYIDMVAYSNLIQSNISKLRYKGVCLIKNKINPWRAYIKVRYKSISLGCYKTELEAAKAYNQYVLSNNLNKKLNLIREE